MKKLIEKIKNIFRRKTVLIHLDRDNIVQVFCSTDNMDIKIVNFKDGIYFDDDLIHIHTNYPYIDTFLKELQKLNKQKMDEL